MWKASSPEETMLVGAALAKTLPKKGVVAFSGNLGAGKTTLIKGIISKLTGTHPDEITSPTFTYLESYGAITHFDLYRLKDENEFLAKGFDDYLDTLCLIEWPEKAPSLTKEAIKVDISGSGSEVRKIEVKK